MRIATPIVLSLILCGGAALAATPEEDWKASIAQGNAEFAGSPHAILKMQDIATLQDGGSAILTGDKGDPASFHWLKHSGSGDVFSVTWQDGHASIVHAGVPVSPDALERGIAIDNALEATGQIMPEGGGRSALRLVLYNQQSADVKAFTGLDFFPYDPAYRVTARFVPDPAFAPHMFRTSKGSDRQYFHAGDAIFDLGGKHIVLPLYTGQSDRTRLTHMSSFFTDTLTGHETYPAGRYLDFDDFGAWPPTTLTIDFNYAYNPLCARSAFYDCAVAMDDIGIPIRAGERDPHKAH